MVVEASARVENPETLQNKEFARILRNHGIKIHDAQKALQFFCGNNWGLIKDLNINAMKQNFPVRHNATFVERNRIGLMRRRASFAFMEGRTYAKAGFFAEGFDFINSRVRNTFSIAEVSRVSSIELGEKALDISGSRYLAVDSERGLHFRDEPDEFTTGKIMESFTLNSGGGIWVSKETFLPEDPVGDFDLVRLGQAMGVKSMDLARQRPEVTYLYLNLNLDPSGIHLNSTGKMTDTSFALVEEKLDVGDRVIVTKKKFTPLWV